jgi:hypothetical protein
MFVPTKNNRIKSKRIFGVKTPPEFSADTDPIKNKTETRNIVSPPLTLDIKKISLLAIIDPTITQTINTLENLAALEPIKK